MIRAALLAAATVGVLAACTPPPPVAYPLAPLERSAQCIAQLATGIIPTRLWADHDAAGYWSPCPKWALDRTRQALSDAGINLATYGQQVTVVDQPLGGAGGRWLAQDSVTIDSTALAGYGDEAPFFYAHETLGHPIALRLGLTFEATP